MVKRIAMLSVAMLLTVLAPAASAADALPLIIDDADVLDPSEEQLLEETARSIAETYETDIVILTVASLEGRYAQEFADDFFDAKGYGYGDTEDGILYLLAMEEREWYISTCGDMIYAVTGYGIRQLGDTALWYLSEGNYFGGFSAYLEALSGYLQAYHEGDPVDGYADYSGDHYHGKAEETVYYSRSGGISLLLSAVIGLIAAAATILIMRSGMNTKRQQRSASGYVKEGAFHMRTHQDLFLYSNVSKVRRQQTNGAGTGRGGGGSSVHRSSGGRRHGGGGGRF